MAFVVETGAGLSNANSYASVSAADSYVADRGIAGWTALSTTIKQQSLVNATDYLEATYRSAWKGNRVSETQSLSWPRYNVIVDGFNFASNVVPLQVINACIEMAIRASAGETLLADQGQRVRREKIDVIEVEYQDYSDPTQRYPLVNRMVMPYLISASESGFSVTRVIRT
jgi:hypothetical protein